MNVIRKVAHFSDTHLGYEAYPKLTPRGDNARGVDLVRAVQRVVEDIEAWDPDLVIHSGDVAERPRVDFRYLLFFQQMLNRLRIRPDGSLRPVVVIAGNHDAPRSRKEVCFLELYREIEGVHVVTAGYQPIDLGNVVVHAVPHDTLKSVDFDDVRPYKGRLNVFTSHGVAEGSELFLRAIGREFPIPADVLARDWDYAALGHWHKQGQVEVGSNNRVWYAGSTENISFRDLRDDDGMKRGWLAVTLGERPGDPITVEPRYVPIRRMFRLPTYNGAGKTPEEIVSDLVAAVKQADIEDAVVGQVVEGVSRDVWSLCDIAAVRRAAASALHFQFTVRPVADKPVVDVDSGEGSGLGDIDATLTALAKETVAKDLRDEVLEEASRLLKAAADESDDIDTEGELAA